MHLDWDKTVGKLYEYYWFEGIAKYVRIFVENCHACQVTKTSSGKVQAELYPKISNGYGDTCNLIFKTESARLQLQ